MLNKKRIALCIITTVLFFIAIWYGDIWTQLVVGLIHIAAAIWFFWPFISKFEKVEGKLEWRLYVIDEDQ